MYVIIPRVQLGKRKNLSLRAHRDIHVSMFKFKINSVTGPAADWIHIESCHGYWEFEGRGQGEGATFCLSFSSSWLWNFCFVFLTQSLKVIFLYVLLAVFCIIIGVSLKLIRAMSSNVLFILSVQTMHLSRVSFFCKSLHSTAHAERIIRGAASKGEVNP